jgi:hypothetical protein
MSIIEGGGKMRVLLSGILGAIAGAAVWLACDHFLQTKYGWLVCLVGIFTGVAIRMATAVHAKRSFINGTLAVVFTLAAILGGRVAYAKLLQANFGRAPTIAQASTASKMADAGVADTAASDAATTDAETTDAETTDAETTDAAATDAEVADSETTDTEVTDTEATDIEAAASDAAETRAAVIADRSVPPNRFAKLTTPSDTAHSRPLSQWGMLWMSLAALAAYVISQGGEPSTPAASGNSDEESNH